MHRVVFLLDEGRDTAKRLEVTRPEPTLASAVVGAVRDADAGGRPVVRVLDDRDEVLIAADLVVRLRRVAGRLSEEELALLLDLLPL